MRPGGGWWLLLLLSLLLPSPPPLPLLLLPLLLLIVGGRHFLALGGRRWARFRNGYHVAETPGTSRGISTFCGFS